MKAYTNGTDTIVAESVDDIRAVLVDLYGDGDDVVEMMNEGFAPIDDDKPITINTEEPGADGRTTPRSTSR